MYQKLLHITVVSALSFSAGAVQAATIYAGTFAGSDPDVYVDGSPDFNASTALPGISGEWSFVFDESLVTSGFQVFSGIPVDYLILNPDPLGGVVYDASNTVAELIFDNGALWVLRIGGEPDGAEVMSASNDDFWAYYDAGSMATNAVGWSLASESSIFAVTTSAGGAFSVTPVPLPAGIWLFGSAVLGLGAVKRRRA